VHAAALKDYFAILTMEQSNRGDDVDLENLREFFVNIMQHSGDIPGHAQEMLRIRILKLFLLHLQVSVMHANKWVIWPINFLTKKQRIG